MSYITYSEEYRQQILESTAKISALLGSLGEPQVKERLLKEVMRIISTSRLENHPDVARFSEIIKSVVEAFIGGRVSVTDNVKTTLRMSMKEIERNLNNKRPGIDSGLTDELKKILRYSKSEERDFMIARTIKVLYVDDDKFAHSAIKKIVEGKSIKIESCFTGKEALSLLKTTPFDVLLCELKLPDMNAFDIIKQLSSKLPIIVISGSDDAKVVQLTTRAGALDYIVKNDMGIKWIPRSLHTVVNEWKKQTSRAGKNIILENKHARKIVKDMIKGGVPIKEQICSRVSVGQKFADESTDEYLTALKSLTTTGFVTKQLAGMSPACPKCECVSVAVRYVCQKCGNSDFTRGPVIEHPKCAHIDFERNFQDGKGLFCPKCSREVEIEGEDYFRLGLMHKCSMCRNVFETPEEKYDCLGCGHANFISSQASWVPLYEYFINSGRLSELKNSVASLDPLRDYLAARGYKVYIDQKIDTKYQTFGPFDLVAHKDQNHVFVLVLGTNVEENFSKAVELDTMEKMVDYRIGKFAVTFSEPKEMTRNLVNKFEIMLVTADDEDTLLERFKEYL